MSIERVIESLRRTWAMGLQRAPNTGEQSAWRYGFEAGRRLLEAPGALNYTISEFPLEVSDRYIEMRTRLTVLPAAEYTYSCRQIPLIEIREYRADAPDLLSRTAVDSVVLMVRELGSERTRRMTEALSNHNSQPKKKQHEGEQ